MTTPRIVHCKKLGQDLPEPVDDALFVLLYHLERARSRDYPEYDQDHDDGEDCTHRDHLSSLPRPQRSDKKVSG